LSAMSTLGLSARVCTRPQALTAMCCLTPIEAHEQVKAELAVGGTL